MRDGTVLLADHYAPVTAQACPTLLIRCPYGRGPMFGYMNAQWYAERGYHVIVQSVRGTFGSKGVFSPGTAEAADAQDTVAWLRRQAWFDGRLAALGASYLGYTAWSLAMDPPPELKALVVTKAVHDLHAAAHAQGPFHLADMLMWADLFAHQESLGTLRNLRHMYTAERRLTSSFARLPLAATGDTLGGVDIPWYREWIDHPDAGDALWRERMATSALETVDVPTMIFGGLHDVFLEQTLEQYHCLRRRGVEVALTLGPWTHYQLDQALAVTETLAWLDHYVCGRGELAREHPVRVQVGGTGQWEGFTQWPPTSTASHTLYLRAPGRLEQSPSEEGEAASTAFTYDPADPTPSPGGATLSPGAGPRDNAAVEARPDVLTFTTAPLPAPLVVYGAPTAVLHVSSDSPYTDYFVRLCDVDAKGRSRNVADRIIRPTPEQTTPGAPRSLTLTLPDVAHSFAAGHRVRIQISGGAHPRYARNTGAPDQTDTTNLTATTRHVHHSPALPSTFTVPTAIPHP
ncbi:CocE/NonD family hydrolase [Amycolatopsis sp. NPDC049253]|uniref:CocE/NonD family hydrolase n=1 Tax=Amycolatopsis sp. NPDC049253 TaxID=3155274 RepID=UPI0034260410